MAEMILTVKLRLRDKHCAELNRQARAVNYVWNYLNETSKKAWVRDRKWLSNYELQALTSGCSKQLNIHSHTVKSVCHWFTIVRDEKKRAGLRWRGKKSLGWVPFNTGHLSFDGESFSFRKVKYQPMHSHPRLKASVKIRAGSFNQDARGRWYVNLPIEIECANKTPAANVGIDLGLKDFATFSNGFKVGTPSFYRRSEIALGNAQKSNKSKRVLSIHRKIANRRKDFLHKVSASIVKQFGLVIVGDVSPSKLSKTKMAKSVNDAGWSDFRRMLSYKSQMNGGSTIEVSERNTTQTCHQCRALPAGRPKGIAGLSKRIWACDCGTVHDRDVNAALNIRRIGLDTLVAGAVR